MEYKGLVLDKFQEDAISAIESNHSVVVSAPTGSGKTLIADYIINRDVKDGIKVIYTAPIKALSNQKYKESIADYGKDKVGIITGDVVINPGALIIIMTTEVYRNMAITKDRLIDSVSYVVLDEIHYINDIERGYVWEESIIFSDDRVRFLCLSATIPNAEEFASWIHHIKKHPVITVKHPTRSVHLHRGFYDTELGLTTLEDIRDLKDIPDYAYAIGKQRRINKIRPPNHIELIKEMKDKLPCFFFNFSREGCQKLALELAQSGLSKGDPSIMSFVRNRLESAPKEISDLKSTKALRQTLPLGIAFHHAGLIPIMKDIVEQLFSEGKINVLYTTETFAVGINMPAKTVCFKSARKFDGVNFRFLHSKEYFQIAGRAGRRGIDKEGFVYMMIDRRDFDYEKLKKITTADKEPIVSQFKLSVNTVLNLVLQHTPEEIEKILHMSFYTYQHGNKTEIKSSFNNICRKLVRLGYIGEMFATDFYTHLNEYQMMLIIASLCYEPRERTEFYKMFPSKSIDDLRRKTAHEPIMKSRFSYLDQISAMMHPCYYGHDIFDILKNTDLLEGDIIRFFRQMIDRFSQIKNATDDRMLRDKIVMCQDIITKYLV
ncbi:MAG: DEAD/DEAH box helicase, partial [Candidatus Woesearchaeota archaeon]|nr:DEAD/DEAH box helicase [Candidatus Woesearchaeota archaeon]